MLNCPSDAFLTNSIQNFEYDISFFICRPNFHGISWNAQLFFKNKNSNTSQSYTVETWNTIKDLALLHTLQFVGVFLGFLLQISISRE